MENTENSGIKISVIMPVYNAYDYLKLAIDTVLSQTLRDLELICIDDGSTDGSLSIIKECQSADERIRIVTENNAGPSVARNKGIVRARGEFVIFLDADDIYEPTLLETLYKMAIENDLDIAVASFDILNNKKGKYSPATPEPHGDIFASGAVVSKSEFPDYILQSTTGYVWNKLFRASFIKEKELTFEPELYVFEDVHFVCTALSLASRVAKTDSVLIHHRVYSEQSRAKLFKKYYSQVPVVYFKIKEFLMQHGNYVPLTRSFLNLSAGRCYKIFNLLWSDAKEKFWDELHSGYADTLGWYQHEPYAFEDKEVYEFVANVGLYTYAQYQKRTSKGRKLKTEHMTQTNMNTRIKGRRLNEKAKAKSNRLFAKLTKPLKKLFGKSKKKESEQVENKNESI